MAEDIQEISDEALAQHVANLAEGRRRARQESSHVIAQIAAVDSSRLHDHVDVLIEALYRPEAQTRWEILDALSRIAQEHAELVGNACEGAEAALFDETSSAVRLAAFRFLTRYGASSSDHSDEIWHLLDEAVQCYHGDPEYRDMLSCLLEYAHGDLSEQSRSALNTRVSFDAEHGHGYIKTFSADILKASGITPAESDE